MRRKTSSRFPICTKLSGRLASFKPTLTGIGKREEVFRRMLGHNWTKKSKNHKKVKSKMKKKYCWTCENIFFRFSANQVSDTNRKRYKTTILIVLWYQCYILCQKIKINNSKHDFWMFARSLYKFPCFVFLVVLWARWCNFVVRYC